MIKLMKERYIFQTHLKSTHQRIFLSHAFLLETLVKTLSIIFSCCVYSSVNLSELSCPRKLYIFAAFSLHPYNPVLQIRRAEVDMIQLCGGEETFIWNKWRDPALDLSTV